jgi:DeoR family transcriptional regulator of aga operon/DeoR family fructose operon transcriptional repressor
MLAPERMELIVEIANRHDIITVEELMRKVGCSKATLRRDINKLSESGRIRKTHGGIMSVTMGAGLVEPSLGAKSNLHMDEKRRIAAAALKHVKKNECVILDSGTTVLELAKLFDDSMPFTAVTYDLLIAMEIAKRPAIDLIMLGGVLRKNYYSLYGYFAEDMLKGISANKAFVTVDSVDVGQGLMNYSSDDIALKKLIVDSCDEVILMADHSKFEVRSFLRICGLSRVGRIITGRETREAHLERLREMGIEFELV